MRQAPVFLLKKPAWPGSAAEFYWRNASSCRASSTYTQILVWSSPVKSFHTSLLPIHKVQTLQLGMKSANLLLSSTNFSFSSYTLPTDRRVSCLLASLLCYPSFVPCILSSELMLLSILDFSASICLAMEVLPTCKAQVKLPSSKMMLLKFSVRKG